MGSERETYSTRRKVLAASGSATMLGLAGCLGGDDETDDGTAADDTDTDDTGDGTATDENGGSQETEQTVTLLVEGVGGYGHGDEVVSQFDIIDRDTDEVTAYIHGDHWDGSLPHIHEGEHISLGAYVEDGHGDEIELDGDHYELRVELAHGAQEDIVSFDYHGDHVHVIGDHHGETEVVFQLYHDDHVDYETPPIAVEVEDNDDHGHDDEDEHGHEDDGHDDDEDDHGHDDEDDHGHDDEDDHGHEGLSEDEIGHACTHLEEIEQFGAEEVAGGSSAEEATHLSEVHHPYHVTFDGDAGYIKFEMGDHDDEDEHDDDHDGELLAFFTQDGSADVVSGELVYSETEEVDRCGPMDRYILVDPDHGEAVIELSPEL